MLRCFHFNWTMTVASTVGTIDPPDFLCFCRFRAQALACLPPATSVSREGLKKETRGAWGAPLWS